jgi:hypothetical protein
MAGPFKMKGSAFYGKGNQSPVRAEDVRPDFTQIDQSVGAPDPEPKKKNLIQMFKESKLGQDLATVASDLQGKAKTIKTATDKVTKKFGEDLSSAKGKIEKQSQKHIGKVVSDITELSKKDVPRQFVQDLRKLFSRKKKKK